MELALAVPGELGDDELEDLSRRALVANRRALDHVEQVVRHEIRLVRLAGAGRPKLRGGRLRVHE